MALNYLILTHKKIDYKSILTKWKYSYKIEGDQIIVYNFNRKARLLIDIVPFIIDEFDDNELSFLQLEIEQPIVYSVSFSDFELMRNFIKFYYNFDCNFILDDNHGGLINSIDLMNKIDKWLVLTNIS